MPAGKDLAYRALLAFRGRARWHWRYYGWDYRAQRTDRGWEVQVLGQRLECADLGAWQPRCACIHILLSGPSVAGIADPRRLADAPTIAVNGSYRVLTAAGCRADLYLVSDVGYVRRQWQTFVDGVRNARALAVDHRVLLEVCRRDARLLDGVSLYLFDNLQRPYRRSSDWWRTEEAARYAVLERQCAFSMDARAGYFPSCTVAYLALQIAATQRPQRIVLFGLDLGGGGARYYAEAQPEKSMIDDDYARCILPHFQFAAGVLREAGIEVRNASPDSRLPDAVFARVPPASCLDTAGAGA